MPDSLLHDSDTYHLEARARAEHHPPGTYLQSERAVHVLKRNGEFTDRYSILLSKNTNVLVLVKLSSVMIVR